jgi:hypothetical protein
MKSKKLLFSTLLSLGCMATYLTMTSSNSGQMGVAATGCGSCHGSQNNATTITVTGIPATGYVAGTSYPVTLTVANAAVTLTHGGFDLNFSGGTISNAPAQTMVMGTELHHTSKKAMTGGSVSWSFNWTAPNSSAVTLNVSANAVNNNNGDSGDQWNKVTLNYTLATPTSVSNVAEVPVTVYPNPAAESIKVTALNATSFRAISLTGSAINLDVMNTGNNEYTLNTKNLASGMYILLIHTEAGMKHTKFVKQ